MIYSHIPFDSLREVDGVSYYLRGRDLKLFQLVVATEWQPSSEIISIIHDINNCLSKINQKELTSPDDNSVEFEFAKGKIISKSDIKLVFEAIVNQLKKPFYGKYAFVKKFNEGKLNIDKFYEANLLDQMKFILSMLNLITLNGSLFNAELIDGAANETCKYLTNLKGCSVYLISQSVTGLYEKRIKIIDPQ